MKQHRIHTSSEDYFYLDATEFCSFDEIYEMGSLPLDNYIQFLTPKYHFLEYISRTVVNVSAAHEAARRFVLRFKEGEKKAQRRAVWMIVNAIWDNDLAGEEYTLMCIPASTEKKNKIRYKNFMKRICKVTHNINGFDLVKITSDREEVHAGASRTIVNYELPKDLSGKKIILFDDVETTGKTFARFSEDLESRGAEVIQGIFLAQAMPK